MKAVVFGAGSIGRGFIGDLLGRSGAEIVLVDVDKTLLNALSISGEYTVHLVDNNSVKPQRIKIKCAINGAQIDAVAKEVASCDVVFTAVGMNALKYIVPALAKGLKRRTSTVNIILCENMPNADDALRTLLQKHLDNSVMDNVGLVRASVGRMVPLPVAGEDPLIVKAEPYAHLPIDADGVVGSLPAIVGIELVAPFNYAIERKLYIHNLGHVACAWYGKIKGYQYIWQAIEDKEIKDMVLGVMYEAAAGLVKKYAIDEADLKMHIEELVDRFANKALGDTVKRVGRDIKRKLALNDRVMGALKLTKAYNLPNDKIKAVMAMGLKLLDYENTNRQ